MMHVKPWGQIESLTEAHKEYDALAARLAASERTLPCGHHHSLNDSYGGCVLCITLRQYADAGDLLVEYEARLAEAHRMVQNCLLVVPEGKFKRDANDWLGRQLGLADSASLEQKP